MEAVATTAEGLLSAHKTKRELNLTSSVCSAVALGCVVSKPGLVRKPCSAAYGCLCCPAYVAKKKLLSAFFDVKSTSIYFFLLFSFSTKYNNEGGKIRCVYYLIQHGVFFFIFTDPLLLCFLSEKTRWLRCRG